MVSELAAKHVKVVLGGQGGDEIFGGYARYLIAYFEQCINAAIEGSYKDGNYVVTIESIVPNLGILREYKPTLREFWREGLFSDFDSRYFRLIDRSSDMTEEIDWHDLDKERVFQAFQDDLQQHGQCWPRGLFRQDDPFRLQMSAASLAPGRGPNEHGARAREPCPTSRSSIGGVCCDRSCRCKVQWRRHEASAQAFVWQRATCWNSQSPRQDGLPSTAQGMVRRRSTGFRTGPVSVACGSLAPIHEREGGPCQFRSGRAVFA